MKADWVGRRRVKRRQERLENGDVRGWEGWRNRKEGRTERGMEGNTETRVTEAGKVGRERDGNDGEE